MRTAIIATILLVTAGCSGPPAEPDVQGSPTGGTPAARDAPADDPRVSEEPVKVKATKETGVIRGVVVDEAINPIGGAKVSLNKTGESTLTNTKGEFGFEFLRPGVYFLNITHSRYYPGQTSASVVAGVAAPDYIDVVLTRDESSTPRLEQHSINLHVPGDICLAGDCRRVMSGSGGGMGLPAQTNLFIPTTGSSQAIQIEVHWDPTVANGKWGALSCGASSEAGGATYDTMHGIQEIAGRVPGWVTNDGASAPITQFRCDFAADGDADTIVTMINQDAQAIVHVFYNFEPPADWTFGAHGDPVVPP